MALTNDGALNILRKDQTEFTNFASGVTTIDAKKSCAFYITDAKELYAAFNNNVGQLGAKDKFLSEPKLVKKQVEWVSTSGLHTVIKTENGEILSSGYNNCGQLGLGDSRNKFAKFVTVTK
jgi:alpha-tubulin suppressor-like RCC1 family protein